MPTTPKRASKLIRSRQATPFWRKGIFCIRLNREPKSREKQPIACGVDPGSKKHGFTAKSEARTYLNIQVDAVTWVKKRVETRRNLRRSRRTRTCPYRKPRWANRSRVGFLPPSTKARWQLILRVVNILRSVLPITDYVVEDVGAVSKKGQRRWNSSFSPVQHGKNHLYYELRNIGELHLREGWENKELRDALRLKKTSQKLSDSWNAHCVDSWVMCHWLLGGELVPDNMRILHYTPLQFHRRQLHKQNFQKGHIRPPYGSTRSLGFKRGSIVKHPKYGLTYVGGTDGKRISLHEIESGKRLAQNVRVDDCKFVCFNSFRWRRTSSAA